MTRRPLPLQVSLAILAGIVTAPATGAHGNSGEIRSSKANAKDEQTDKGIQEWCRVTGEVLRGTLDAASREKLEKAKAILCSSTDHIECSPD